MKWALPLLFASLLDLGAQVQDARKDLQYPVNPPRPVASRPAPTKILSTPPPVPSPSGSPAAFLQPADAEFKIEKTTISDNPDGSKIITVLISHDPQKHVSVADVRIFINIFEKDASGKIVLSDTRIQTTWTSAPVDWKDTNPEELSAACPSPKKESGRAYYGCAVGVFYKNSPQDKWATSPDLLNLVSFK